MARQERLLSRSRVTPEGTPRRSGSTGLRRDNWLQGDRKALAILYEAKHYWDQMDRFRRDRERNKMYTYGDQWSDRIEVDGKMVTEEQYIISQGNIPLKNNLIRRLVQAVTGVYLSQNKEPTCTARDRDEQKLGETMSTVLQYNMQLNNLRELYATKFEEFLMFGLVVQRKWFGWNNRKYDCWTSDVNSRRFFVDNNMTDPLGRDVSMLGEIHDASFEELCEQFAKSPSDIRRLREIYSIADDPERITSYALSFAPEFGYSRLDNVDFLLTNAPGRCRVIEVWRLEMKEYRECHDWMTGNLFLCDPADYKTLVADVNAERLARAREAGMPEEDVPLITAPGDPSAEPAWKTSRCWRYYYLTPFGQILAEGDTPYEHGEHPYVFRAYPFIDGEIHSFVADVIDQQRYTNRLITMYDWIMRASAKGVLMIPEDSIPEGESIEDIAEAWTEYNGVIVFRPSKSGQLPQQIANNSTQIGISELLNLQLKFFEDISGVSNALQGKAGYSGESAAHFNQQTENSTKTILGLLERFSSFVIEAAYKDVKNIQQCYDDKRIINIAGRNAVVEYDPDKIRDVEFDLSISESTTTPSYRMFANDMLMQLYQTQAISVEQLLENGDFPFADQLLQSIRSQRESLEQGQAPEGISPELMRQAAAGADQNAVNTLYGAMRG